VVQGTREANLWRSRRSLHQDHPYRFHPNAKHFNGQEELQDRPKTPTCAQTSRQAMRTENWVAHGNLLGAKGCPSKSIGVKRWSSLFTLPYWEVGYHVSCCHTFYLGIHMHYSWSPQCHPIPKCIPSERDGFFGLYPCSWTHFFPTSCNVKTFI